MMFFDYLENHQLNIMLSLSVVCAILAVFVLFLKTISAKRKATLISLDLSAGLLLVFERYSYIYLGDISSFGQAMTRICNFFVYFLMLFCIMCFNFFLADLCQDKDKKHIMPARLWIVQYLLTGGMILLIISQFSHMYYYFTEDNIYVRSSTFWVSYIAPFISLLIQLTVIISYRDKLKKGVRNFLLVFSLLPFAASLLTLFTKGISFTDMSLAIAVILLFIFTIIDVSNEAEKAQKIEIEYLKKEQKDIQILLEQTTEALATAIDVKDPYTHGHSTRVAEYSKKIAAMNGKSEEECDEIYFVPFFMM